MLREMTGGLPGKHDELPAARAEQETRSVRYDSAVEATEWTGPVTPYTPANRK